MVIYPIDINTEKNLEQQFAAVAIPHSLTHSYINLWVSSFTICFAIQYF